MIEKSNEVIKELNRLVNDRSLKPQVRNKISRAAQHIKDLHQAVSRISELHLKLSRNRADSTRNTAGNNQ